MVGLDSEITFKMKDVDKVDLNLALLNPAGDVLATASTPKDQETVSVYVAGGTQLFARVFPYAMAPKKQGVYEISAYTAPATCCQTDANEPNESVAKAKEIFGPVYGLSGTLCAFDTDYYKMNVATAKTPLKVDLTWTGDAAFVDRKFIGPLPETTKISVAIGQNGKTVMDVLVETPGNYAIAVLPFGSKGGSYNASITLGKDKECDFTYDCPVYTVCNEGKCVSDECTDVLFCPLSHQCLPRGPEAGRQHSLRRGLYGGRRVPGGQGLPLQVATGGPAVRPRREQEGGRLLL